MHHSRLCGFIIDCQGMTIGEATDFWSGALGRPSLPPDPDDPNYRTLRTAAHEPYLMVQRVEHEGRVHLDIESDDLEAEARRLEQLGASRVAFVKRWWVMQAPSGQRFCIVNPQRGPLTDENSNRWP